MLAINKMAIIIDDIYLELIIHLELHDQLKLRCTSKSHLNKINSRIVQEYINYKNKCGSG